MNTRPEASSPVSDDGELVERLRQKARSASEAHRMMAEAKTARQTDREDAWTDAGYGWVQPEQTDEWKAADRILSLREAGEALVAKLDECQPHIDGAFAFMALHGDEYSGPQYGEALNAFRAALRGDQHKEEG